MTRFHGYANMRAPCCGAAYRTRRYLSLNYMAVEYWTDGYRDRSLMPNDNGLRKCACGAFYVTSEMVTLDDTECSDFPDTGRVGPEELGHAIHAARNPRVELAARLDYWHHLNHAYRAVFRAHREAEDAAMRATWERANPDQRSLIEKVLKRPRRPKYKPAHTRPVTFPAFHPSDVQRENMCALVVLLTSVEFRNDYHLELVELLREQGEFASAAEHLRTYSGDDDRMALLFQTLIQEQVTGPVRFAY